MIIWKGMHNLFTNSSFPKKLVHYKILNVRFKILIFNFFFNQVLVLYSCTIKF